MTSRERPPKVKSRYAYFVEVVAYLAAHEHGATAEQVAEAFSVHPNTIHSRMGELRRWLGEDPGGEWYLPESTLTPSFKARGVPLYELPELITDADLFRRLRARGQARGPEGMKDLVTALRLVQGKPFDQLRHAGYGWLAENPIDHHLTAGIVDVAHIVATVALAHDDRDRARWASEIGIVAAPSDDKPRLDVIAAEAPDARSDSSGPGGRHRRWSRSSGASIRSDALPCESQQSRGAERFGRVNGSTARSGGAPMCREHRKRPATRRRN